MSLRRLQMQQDPLSVEVFAQEVKVALRDLQVVPQVELMLQASEVARYGSQGYTYHDGYLLLQLTDGTQGYAWTGNDEVDVPRCSPFIGQASDQIDFAAVPDYFLVALIDALAPACFGVPRPYRTVVLAGNTRDKSRARAECLRNLLPITATTRVGILGAMEDVIRAVGESTDDVRIADLACPGDTVSGRSVESEFLEILSWCDAAIVTGNTLKTHTLEEVSAVIRDREIPAVAYCITGHNLLPAVMDRLPFWFVTTEDFPFYWYSGVSSLRIFRQDQTG